jgi:hypothetical protein
MRQELRIRSTPFESIALTLTSRTMVVFLLFWLAFGMITNVNNLRSYTLQQAGVDAIVAHGTFTLGHSRQPRLKPAGDTFTLNGRILAAKQPGQFVFGAIPYTALYPLGITYERNYNMAAALVTWLSAGLLAALALALLDRLMWRLWRFDRVTSLSATLSLGLASTWLCYAGIAHHDVIAAALVVFALYAMECNRLEHKGRNARLALMTGALLGLTIFVSMLPALIVLALGASIAISKQRSVGSLLCHGAGFLIGILPLLIYNGWYFGSPLLPANIAGNYGDTFPTFNLEQHLHHLNAYLGTGGISLWKYAPALGLGILGFRFMPQRLGHMRTTLLTALALHLIYLLSIETTGTCQYGPRYLLPAMPLLVPGVAALLDSRWLTAASVKWMAMGALLAYGLLINLVGAVQGTIYCNLDEFALWGRIVGTNELSLNHFPLFNGVVTLLALWGLIVAGHALTIYRKK